MVSTTLAPTLLALGSSTHFDHNGLARYVSGLPWPRPDNSVEQASINHTLEYLSGHQRIFFVNELHRVLAPGGKATLYLPYWSSTNAVADPYLVWPPINEMSIQYLADAEFRSRNRLNYPGITADFRIAWGYSYTPEFHVRNDAYRDTAIKHWLNSTTQFVCTLTKPEVSVDSR